ncbi:MAG: UMP kinase [Desulfurococcaceae archaeon]
MERQIIVLKITGKAFDNGYLLRDHIDVLKELLSQGYKLIVVAGGGSISRRYIDIAMGLGIGSNYWLDIIGIWGSRLNGLLIISALDKYAYPRIPLSIDEIIMALKNSDLVVSGGLIPGQSTASVLLQIAEAVNAKKVYYYSAIGMVYDKDPAIHPDAKPLSIISASELKTLLRQKTLPGEYALIDEKALDYAIRSGIEIYILDYKKPRSILQALNGENPGSIILPH